MQCLRLLKFIIIIIIILLLVVNVLDIASSSTSFSSTFLGSFFSSYFSISSRPSCTIAWSRSCPPNPSSPTSGESREGRC